MPEASVLPPEAPSVADYGAFVYWPEHVAWSNQLNRLIGYIGLGGADFSEVHCVARELPVGDEEAWRAGFAALARRLDELAAAAADVGRQITARDTWLRASVYYRFAGQLHALGGGPVPHVEDSIRCFRAAIAYKAAHVQPADVPLEAAALAGYLLTPTSCQVPADRPQPAVIVTGGIDAFAEEMYLKIGTALRRRGSVVLLLDGPGQGESARRGLAGRHDFEVACAAAVDFLTARADVDPGRIAFVGQSLGGYYATRAAAYETRLAACVIWGATGNFFAEVGHRVTEDSPLAQHRGQAERFFGVSGANAVKQALQTMSLEGVPELIRCPTLILHGAADIQIPVAAARWTHDHITNAHKQLIIYPAGQPGGTHCQLDSPLTAQRDIGDFLDSQLKPAQETAA
jgi:pimeloyl-ACP methyl ester carboxylesterase